MLRYTIILFFILLASVRLKAKRPNQERPNVIVVLVDDLGKGDMGCYGNKLVKTPHLDSFYQEFIRLNDFHVSPTCAPSRSSFMIGKYYHQVGVHATIEGREMPFAHEQMMPEVFVKNGYKTALFGKWHLGDAYPFRPEDRGFEYVVGMHGGGLSQVPDYWGNDYFNDTYWVNGKLKKINGFCTDVWFQEAKKYIKEVNKSKQPFFAYIATNAPHGPFRAPKKYLDMYDNQLTPAPFYGMITNIDDNFGDLVQFLKDEGIEENTILIFTSDNGSNIGTYFFDANMSGKKSSYYEGGHKVPFFIRWPKGNLTGGKDVNALTAHVDLLPTFIDMLDFEDTGVDYSGHSFKASIDGDHSALKDRTLIVNCWPLDEWHMTAVAKDKWRLIENKELYNLEEDPMQYHNLYHKYPAIVKSLDVTYREYRENIQENPISYFVIGNEKQNPTWFNCHDIRTPRKTGTPHRTPPVSQGSLISRPLVKEAPWMVHIDKGGNYEISIRRYPAEVDLPINTKYRNPTSNFQNNDSQLHAKRAFVDIAGIYKEMDIPQGVKEVTFKLKLPKKDSLAFKAGYLLDGKRYAAQHVYVLNSDIYKGDLNHWQTREGLGFPLAMADHTDCPKINFKDPRHDDVKKRRLPPYLPKEGETMKANSLFAWTTSTSNLEGSQVYYRIEIATDIKFANIVLSKHNVREQIIALEKIGDLSSLTKGTSFYVRLKAFNENGKKTDYSKPVSFKYI